MEELLARGIDEGKITYLLQKMIQIPSLSGQEGPLADFLKETMETIGFDEVRRDSVGNIIGRVKGCGRGPTILYHAHLDHVPVGNMADPYSGKVVDASRYGKKPGKALYGRGAVDNKGALAAMLGAVMGWKGNGVKPPGDMLVAGVVLEEMSGSPGSRQLVQEEKIDLAIIGEPTSLDVSLGHRSSLHFDLELEGKSAHASAPHNGENALYPLSAILAALQVLSRDLPGDPLFGASTLAACDVEVKPGQRSVIPQYCRLAVNFRGIPTLSSWEMQGLLEKVLQVGARQYPKVKSRVRMASETFKAYTGREVELTGEMLGFYTDPSLPPVKTALHLARRLAGPGIREKVWDFATDGGIFHVRGIPTLGFGPGDEALAHTDREHISIEELCKAAAFYACYPFALE